MLATFVPAIRDCKGFIRVRSIATIAFSPTKPTVLPTGFNPYFNPNPATGNNGIAPLIVAPSAPNFNLLFNVSVALSLPVKSSPAYPSSNPNCSPTV